MHLRRCLGLHATQFLGIGPAPYREVLLNFAAFAYQPSPPARPPAPGAPAGEPQAAANTGTAAPGAPGAPQEMPPPPGGGFAMLIMPLLLVAMLVFMWWTSKSQQKKQTQMLNDLKKGDRVITQSGLLGKLVERADRVATIEIASGVKVKVLSSSLLGKDTTDAGASESK